MSFLFSEQAQASVNKKENKYQKDTLLPEDVFQTELLRKSLAKVLGLSYSYSSRYKKLSHFFTTILIKLEAPKRIS